MKKYTFIFIAVIIGAIFIYDVVAIMIGGKEASISSMLIDYSYMYPSFSFLMGFVMGHLFWRMRSNKDLKKYDEVKE